MKVLQINSVVNSGSTGRVAEDIGTVLLANGHDSFIAFGRGDHPSESVKIKIGNNLDFISHLILTRASDRHGLGSTRATRDLILKIEKINPDAIGLHNLHGYYLNFKVLFKFLKESDIPVLWTIFDCWPFTGHCAYFDDIQCTKWETECHRCPKTRRYPKSFLLDSSTRNFSIKKDVFNDVNNLHLVVHSKWLASLLKKSFLQKLPIHIINNGIDLESFKPSNTHSKLRKTYNLSDKFILLGCANTWDRRKGFEDFIELAEELNGNEIIVLIGLSSAKKRLLPHNIVAIDRTESIEELANWYSTANIFVNPTWQDNFPTTNLEALACGTPVITYNTGGSPEAIDETTGRVVDKGDINQLLMAIKEVANLDRSETSVNCRNRAEKLYNKDHRFKEYLQLYKHLTTNRN